MRTRWRYLARSAAAIILAVAAAACGNSGSEEGSSSPQVSSTSGSLPGPTGSPTVNPTGYAAAVNARCRELLSTVLRFDIGNAVTIDEFLEKHGKLTTAIAAFDGDVDEIPVAAPDEPSAQAFEAYRRFSDQADDKVVTAARTGDQRTFDAANSAYIATIRSNPREIKNLHAAGIECSAR